jgi:glycosyltransferase involved in cell wall biosynthesis
MIWCFAMLELLEQSQTDAAVRPSAKAVSEDRLKVLLCAYSCEPGRGSEPGIGWNVLRALSERNDVWLLTRPHSGAKIMAELERLEIKNVTPLYYDLPVIGPVWRKRHLLGMRLHNYLWQFGAARMARRVHREVRFDVAHHVTFVNYYTPSAAAFIGCPFVWGPVGGAEVAPPALERSFSLFGRTYEMARALRRFVGEMDPFVRRTARRTTVGIATTAESALRMRKLGAPVDDLSSESGLTTEEVERLEAFPLRIVGPTRFISVGRLLHWKGFHLSLQAFLSMEPSEAQYWIIGDGPEYKRLEKMIADASASKRVRLFGNLSRDGVMQLLADADVMIHPSLHDSGGVTPIEGMAAGRPVICLDLGGVATKVTESTGIKIQAIDPDQTVRDLAAAMTMLSNNAGLRQSMAVAGRELVRERFWWPSKIRNYERLHRVAIARAKVSH